MKAPHHSLLPDPEVARAIKVSRAARQLEEFDDRQFRSFLVRAALLLTLYFAVITLYALNVTSTPVALGALILFVVAISADVRRHIAGLQEKRLSLGLQSSRA